MLLAKLGARDRVLAFILSAPDIWVAWQESLDELPSKSFYNSDTPLRANEAVMFGYIMLIQNTDL